MTSFWHLQNTLHGKAFEKRDSSDATLMVQNSSAPSAGQNEMSQCALQALMEPASGHHSNLLIWISTLVARDRIAALMRDMALAGIDCGTVKWKRHISARVETASGPPCTLG